jgi:hypothetical protein
MLECPECGAQNTGPAVACARCGAPIAAQNPVAADRAAGESGYAAVSADLLRQPPPKSRPPKSRLPGASWLAIGGGIAVVLGSFLPWILVYVYDGNVFNDPNGPNLFSTVPVSNSISSGARAASAVFGLILIGFALAIKSASARGVFVKPRAYAYGIPLIALSVLGFAGCCVFAVAGDLGFREANGLGLVGYRIFTVTEKHPVRALDGTVGSAHVSFVPNVGLLVMLLGCVAAIIGAIGSVYYASPGRRPGRHEYQPGGMTAGSGEPDQGSAVTVDEEELDETQVQINQLEANIKKSLGWISAPFWLFLIIAIPDPAAGETDEHLATWVWWGIGIAGVILLFTQWVRKTSLPRRIATRIITNRQARGA